jgi:hypothetical protein
MAYVDAVAGRAGINVSRPLHDYGVDGTFRPIIIGDGFRTESAFQLEFQLKASQSWTLEPDAVVYDLEADAYNKLVTRHPAGVPIVLILMCLPANKNHWLRSTENVLVLRNCCYWLWLAPGSPSTTNSATVRVRIPVWDSETSRRPQLRETQRCC